MLWRMTSTTSVAQTRPAVISRTSAAERLGVSLRTIDRYIERGLLVRHRDAVGRRSGVELAGVARIEAARIPR
jgi:predicted site-specific integrase-resolvase